MAGNGKIKKIASFLQSTLNTRALPVGRLRYNRSDYPGNLTDQEVKWLSSSSDQIIIEDYMESKDNLMGFLNSYVAEHPEVDINTIIPKENNIKRVLEAL